jgi:hypothetical protein
MEIYEQGLGSFNIRPYRMKRLKEYCDRLSHDREGVLLDDNVASVLLAQGYTSEEAPRSIYRVAKLYEALAKYAPINSPKLVEDQSLQSGLALAYTCFARPAHKRKLHPLPFTAATVDAITSNKKASAGLTWYGCTKAAAATRALERGIQILLGQKQPEPCLGFTRTQFNDKTRLVWGYPYSMTAIEGLLAQPLLDQFKSGLTPMAFAIPAGMLGTKLRVASYHREWAYSIDMSSFDASISGKLIHAAFRILRTWYDEDEVEPVSGKTVRDIFDVVERYFIHTPIVMPNGKLYLGKRHGVPSGSFFTQIIDSVVNVIIGGTASHRFKLHVSKKEVFVLGDDLLMWSNRQVDLDTIAKYINEHLGVKMHGSEKSAIYHYDEPVHYLGRDWPNGLPTLDQKEVVKRMIYPERFRRYPKDPEAKAKAVRLLILSYAAVYHSAWSIADKTLGNPLFYLKGANYVEKGTYYGSADDKQHMDPDYLSGLQRYIRKYVWDRTRQQITTTASLYWL